MEALQNGELKPRYFDYAVKYTGLKTQKGKGNRSEGTFLLSQFAS